VQQQQALPRRTLEQWLSLLQAEASAPSGEGGGVPGLCNLREGLQWVQGFAPEAAAVLDAAFGKYFEYIRQKHGADVLTCCVFFCLGHHDSFRGE
jgi:hypothetical protein